MGPCNPWLQFLVEKLRIVSGSLAVVIRARIRLVRMDYSC